MTFQAHLDNIKAKTGKTSAELRKDCETEALGKSNLPPWSPIRRRLFMSSTQTESSSKKMIWTGRILAVLSSLFLLLDGVMKILKPVQVLEATARLGYPVTTLTGIGVTLIACTLLYVLPRTSIVGAVLLTGYLGGAVPATCVRAPGGSRRYSPRSS